MREQASGIRGQVSGGASGGGARIEELLRRALPPVDVAAWPARDLWPDLRRRLEQAKSERSRRVPAGVPWYDWALAGGLALLAMVSPVTVPVLLYYL